MPRQDVTFLAHFADLPDPRLDRRKLHPLIDVLAITLCATVAGADSFEQVAKYGVNRIEWLKTLLAQPNGIPSHDTFGRVLSLVVPARPPSRPRRMGARPTEEDLWHPGSRNGPTRRRSSGQAETAVRRW